MSKDEPTYGLAYVGVDRFLIGVPARDLTEQDITTLALTRKELLASGVYAEAKKPTKPEKDDKS